MFQSFSFFKILFYVFIIFLAACQDPLFDLPVFPNVEIPNRGALSAKTEANFDSIFQTFLTPKCLKCHSPGGKAEDVPLTNYQNVLQTLVPGEPLQSDLYKVVLPDARRKMPPPRSGIPALTEDQTLALYNWISTGAAEFQGDLDSFGLEDETAFAGEE